MAQDAHPTDTGWQSVTVADLLAEPLLRNTLVAGADGVTRAVRWCLPLSELDDSDGPGEPGTAVHAAAAALRDEAGAALVERVAAAGTVALLVRLTPEDLAGPEPLPALFPQARGAADAAALPLALLPPSAGYRTVSQLVATKVLAQTTHVLEYSDRVHRSLGEILARGAGISPLAYGMARMGEAPVVVVDADGAVLAVEATAATGRPAVEPVAAALARYLETVSGGPLPHGAEVLETVADVVPIVAAVTFGGEVNGLVAVLEPRDADPHDRAQRRIVAQEGATLIGSEMLRLRSMTEAEERTRGDFVVDLVHGRFADGGQLQARARHHGFAVDGAYAVHVAELDPPISDDPRAVRRFNAAARAVERLDPDGAAPTLATQVGGNLVVVRPTAHPSDAAAVRDHAGAVRRVLRERLGSDARVAYGRVGTGARGVAASYREARTALALGRRVDVPPVAGYDDLRIFVALQDLADSENGRTFAAEMLAPLRRADGHARSLESVVTAYIAESGNLNAAARRLGLHRNTTLYKLDRVSRVLGMDIRSADTQFMIWLAHHIDTLSQVTDSLDAELAPPP
ncbi:PucR family transcriptional regulator [Pseudonocardia oroxyli]|uniref:Transcriptional regulator, CdaR family n=1 Tax=Pseudonocardia oroxyli TaxID=366584 RepID=A0A1G7G2H0_PSEOR|nr:helix-turn-helix domain-containing protein [Pseudonocardia oroxyli]SDE82255.1 transcriptional regulator, CdaR family [Pseudonocardia oroxyli]